MTVFVLLCAVSIIFLKLDRSQFGRKPEAELQKHNISGRWKLRLTVYSTVNMRGYTVNMPYISVLYRKYLVFTVTIAWRPRVITWHVQALDVVAFIYEVTYLPKVGRYGLLLG